jgi:HK97 gp10 family phage protein
MDRITFDIVGINKVMDTLHKFNKQTQIELKEEVGASALKIQSDAKRNAPVNLGTLRQSIYLNSEIKSEYQYKFTIGSSASYAPYIEFGTGGKVLIPKGFQSYASQFKGKSKGRFKDMLLALTEWVQKKGIASGKQTKSVAYMIAVSILKKGLRPQPFLIPAFEQEKNKLKARIEKIIKDAKS